MDLSGQNLSALPDSIYKYPNLRKLILNHNRLTALPADIAKRLSKLRLVDISFNDFTEIPAALMALPKLRVLSAGHNHIKELPYTLPSSAISELIIDHNDIDFLIPELLTGLTRFIASHNRINIGLIHGSLPNMKYVDLRHNPAIHFVDSISTCLPNARKAFLDPAPSSTLLPDGLQYY